MTEARKSVTYRATRRNADRPNPEGQVSKHNPPRRKPAPKPHPWHNKADTPKAERLTTRRTG